MRPDNEINLRKELDIFSTAMEQKLRANDDIKQPWRYSPNSYLLDRLKEETKELEDALINGFSENIKEECTDVANFCMMLFDNQTMRNQITEEDMYK